MKRLVLRWVCVWAMVALLVGGCSDETAGDGGDGGSGGTGGMGGAGAAGGSGGAGGAPECESPDDCDDGNDCTRNDCGNGTCEFALVADDTACDERNECTAGVCADGECDATPVADDTPCGSGAGTCRQGSCLVACTEQGIRNAIAAGGGPYTFDCDGPTTIITSDTIHIRNDVILDAEGTLTIDGNGGDHILFDVDAAVELHGWTLSGGRLGIHVDSLLTMTNSTVSGNSGGGIAICEGDVTLVNSTVSGNREGIVNACICEFGCRSTLTLVSSTVSGNEARSISNESIVFANTLIDGSCSVGAGLVSNGYNIESPGDTCGFDQPTDQVRVSVDDLKLGPLQDNGGLPETHALGDGSVAIDVIPAVDCVDADSEPLTTDQRGFPRDSLCDVGAFEMQP